MFGYYIPAAATPMLLFFSAGFLFIIERTVFVQNRAAGAWPSGNRPLAYHAQQMGAGVKYSAGFFIVWFLFSDKRDKKQSVLDSFGDHVRIMSLCLCDHMDRRPADGFIERYLYYYQTESVFEIRVSFGLRILRFCGAAYFIPIGQL